MVRIPLPFIIITALVATLLGGAAQVDDAIERGRLERMLDAGDELLITQTFKRHATRVLPFIDSYLEGGLKMKEEGGDEESVMASYRTGVRFAELATKAFHDNLFVDYAASFASWSPQEQANFRRGQQEYKLGRQAESEPEKALAHYEASWALANALDDSWGKAMAAAGQARMKRALGDNDAAVTWGRMAAELYRRLRLDDSAVDAMLLVGEAMGERNREQGLAFMRSAWTMVQERPEEDEQRRKVIERYAKALEQAGRTADAQALRTTGKLPARQ